MKALKRLLGVLVIIAGILGLTLSLAGLIAVWAVKPTLATSFNSILATLNSSVSNSQEAMQITGEALGATVDSVDALSILLGTTATTIEDTRPVLDEVNNMMGSTLPSTVESATESLQTAQQAAEVLDSAIKSLDSFRTVLSGVPIVGSFVEPPDQAYNPEKPLAVSLGELASSLEGLPDTFTDMSTNLNSAGDNLDRIQSSLTTMSNSVGLISQSLSGYHSLIAQSQSSMENLKSRLTSIQNNLNKFLNGAAIVLSLFLLWLLAAQVVILSYGWELYQGTAGRMAAEPSQQDEGGGSNG